MKGHQYTNIGKKLKLFIISTKKKQYHQSSFVCAECSVNTKFIVITVRTLSKRGSLYIVCIYYIGFHAINLNILYMIPKCYTSQVNVQVASTGIQVSGLTYLFLLTKSQLLF